MARKHKEAHEMSNETENEAETAADGFQVIKIAGRPVAIRAPYSLEALREMDDSKLTILANALNALRGENVRNNVAAKMKSIAEKEERAMTDEEIDAYDLAYDMANRSTRVGATIYDPIGKEERRLAQILVDTKLREHATARGLSFKELRAGMDKDTYQSYVSKAVETGKFRAQAERNVRERTEEASLELDFSDAA